MNDKEKLISFINKGKENKPVKEVHVIKDSPTEAHILLVNEDGTNVASNRFEIMNANDLMSLIENSSDSGLIINISEVNKKISIKVGENINTAFVAFDELWIEEDARWSNLAALIQYLNGLGNADTYFYIRKYNIFEEDMTEDLTIEFNNFFSRFPYLIIDGHIGTTKALFKFEKDDADYSVSAIVWQDSAPYFTKVSYTNLLSEYEAYKSVNGPLYVQLYF